MTFHMLQITELYRNIFRFFADKETSFYEADALDASNPNFMLLLLGGAVVCVLISIVIGCKEWSLTGLAILVRIITVTDG